MAGVTLRGVSKRFGSAEVIKNVDLEFADGEFSVVVGPSGCGKSTLLRLIAGLEEVDEGNVSIDDHDITDADPKDRGVAMVFQNYALYPHMTVSENLSFALEMAKRSTAEIDAKVRAVAEALHIGELLERKPSQLSGGQRQRVAVGRAIVRDVGVFLFDEPLSNLDAALRVAMRAELVRLHRELKCTIVYVTHDQVEAMTLADRIVVMDAGKVMQVGTPLQLYHRPANLFVAGFIGSPRMNFIPVEVASTGAEGPTVLSPDLPPTLLPTAVEGLRVGDKATFGVRPEHLNLLTEGATKIEGEVELVERLGRETGVRVTTENGLTLEAIVDGAEAVAAGARLALGFRPEACHLFTSEGRALERRLAPKIADALRLRDDQPRAASATMVSRSAR